MPGDGDRSEVAKFTAPIPNPIIMYTVPMVPVQRVSLVHADTLKQITETSITSAPIQTVSTIRAFTPIPIVATSIVSPRPTELIYCSFSPKMFLTLLQNASSHQMLSPFQKNHPFSILRSKVQPHQKKMPFINETHLQYKKPKLSVQSKDHFCGSSWKKKRESRNQTKLNLYMKRSSQKKSIRSSSKKSSMKKLSLK